MLLQSKSHPIFLRLLRSLNLFPGISPCFVVLMALGIARVEGHHLG
jgi:hypothetical protein